MLPFSADLCFVLSVSLSWCWGIRKFADLNLRQASLSANLTSKLSKHSVGPEEGRLDAIRVLDFQKSANGQFRRKALQYFLWLHVAENSGA